MRPPLYKTNCEVCNKYLISKWWIWIKGKLLCEECYKLTCAK